MLFVLVGFMWFKRRQRGISQKIVVTEDVVIKGFLEGR